MNNPEYSIVVPVFNSEESLRELFQRIQKSMAEQDLAYEVVFVDDGSTDKSWLVLSEIKRSAPDIVTAIKLAKNFGQHNATFCGLTESKGKYVITMDDDLQNPPEEISKLIQGQKESECDLVYGIYTERKQAALRKAYTASLHKTSKRFYNGKGNGSSFRLINRELIDKITQSSQNFVYLDELFVWYTDDIKFVNVRHDSRRHQKSGYTYWGLIKFFSNILMYYTNVPLKVMVYGGLLSSVTSFIIGIFFIVKKIFFNVPILGYTSTIVVITFSTGLILFGLGIIGEYLSRIYMVQNKKPPFSIKKIL